MFGIGAGELVIILIAGLIIFGPSKLPEVGRAIGKGLREFRKAQAAFSATLDEVSAEPVKKNSPPTAEKSSPQTEDKKISLEKNSEEQKAADTPPQNSAVTVDDVINLANQSPLKENMHEKIFNGNTNDSATADGGAGNDDSRGSSNGVEKQPEPSAH